MTIISVMHVLSLVIKNIDQWTAYVSPDWPELVKKKSTTCYMLNVNIFMCITFVCFDTRSLLYCTTKTRFYRGLDNIGFNLAIKLCSRSLKIITRCKRRRNWTGFFWTRSGKLMFYVSAALARQRLLLPTPGIR